MRLSARRLAEISIKLDLKADMSLEVHLSIVLCCGVDMLLLSSDIEILVQ